MTAAFDTLRLEGFAHASARAIAARAGCNPALIFYYFDSVNDLLVAALARSSQTQLAGYQEALAAVDSLVGLVATVQDRLRQDLESGHVKVLVELVGAGAADPELREAVMALVTPWLEFTERTLERVLGEGGLPQLVPGKQVAFAVVSLFLGMELLSGMPGSEDLRAEVFTTAGRVAHLIGAMTGTPGPRAGRQ